MRTQLCAGGGIQTIDPTNPRLHWWPSSIDFAAEAARRAPAVGVHDFRTLLNVIRRYHHLTRVFWYGHGASGELQFGNGIRFTMGEVQSLVNADVSANFDPGPQAELLLVACNAVRSEMFLQSIANALRIPVRGYATGIEWHLEFVGKSPRRQITRRGIANANRTFASGRVYSPL